MSGATVEAIDSASGMTETGTTTDSNGNYALSVKGGTYNIRVTPPAGSGLAITTLSNQAISSNTVLDFVLIPTQVLFTVSGRVTERAGNGIDNVMVRFTNNSANLSAFTDASGHYSLHLPAGSYLIELSSGSTQLLPPNYSVFVSSVAITQDTTIDAQIPSAMVSVHVQDPAGNPVANTLVFASAPEGPSGSMSLSSSLGPLTGTLIYRGAQASTDASGNAVFWVFPGGSYNFSASPPSGSPFTPFRVSSVTIPSDQNLVFSLQYVHAPPVTAASISPSPDAQGVYPNPVSISFSATASVGFTVAATKYVIDNGVTQTCSAPFTFSGPGHHTISYWSVDDAGVVETHNMLNFTVAALNTPPTIGAQTITRQRGSAGAASVIATVSDAETAANNLAVAATAVPTGITVTGITNTNGTVTATVAAECAAMLGANVVVLTVTDGNGGTATASVTVEVTANSPPTLGYANQSVSAAGMLTVSPATGPSDNGSIAAIAVQNVLPPLSTAPTVASNGEVTVSNAGPAGDHAITVRVTDNCGSVTNATFTLNVTCPTITVGPAAIPAGNVGLPFALTTFTAGGANGNVNFGITGTLPDGMSLVNGLLSGTPTNQGRFPVTITAADAYGCSASKDYTLVIDCPDTIINPGTLPIGQLNVTYPAQSFTANGGNAPYTFSVSGALPTGMSFAGGTLSGTPAQYGDFPITVTAKDRYGCTTGRSYTLKVNRAPVALCQNVTVTSDATCSATVDINHGSTDPDGDDLTITQSPSGPYAVGTHRVTMTVDDGRGGVSACSASVTVNPLKPAPTISRPAAGAVYSVGTPVGFTGRFTDLAGTTHTAAWGVNNITQGGTVNEATGEVTATHTFTAAGVYPVILTVSNSCGGVGSAKTVDGLNQVVVVYDPDGGFVTCGGWIDSPAGAYVPAPSLTGKANFSFVSKYKNGASVPTGDAEFEFKAGNLNFKGTSYEWMVISGGKKAQCEGTGTINGSGGFHFMLTVIDGRQPGGEGKDKLRIKIWSDGGGLVYDNQPNAPDGNDPTTLLGGGSIVIHK